MSKMSQLHAELSEQASSLGYQSIEEAEANGYEIDYTKGVLVDGRELAHNDWLKEREEVLKRLNDLYDELVYISIDDEYLATVNDTIDFIKKGEI